MTLPAHWEGEPVRVWASLWGIPLLEAHEVLDSTNDRARRLAAEGALPFTVVLAEEQTRGRGRSGAVWHSPPGAGLWMSVLLPAPAGPETPHLPLLVGLAAARACETALPEVRIGVKWPNDLEVAGRKVGGILCERVPTGVVAGIGLNVRVPPGGFPDELAGRATALETPGGTRVRRSALAGALLGELRALCHTPGARLRPELLEELAGRDVLLGRRVDTRQAGEGRALGIAGDGALVLERPDGGEVRVVAGSVRALEGHRRAGRRGPVHG
ncbi:MAG TPA: biotin--[acetyl-CoA-carboxylase] ligase [Longimicrobiales bacterium]|nr:biotin--[acetyl-CoA-carboxylase] ligase [Longimicrobiales bacterium]